MRIKFFALVAAGSLLGLVFNSCGSKSSDSPAETPVATATPVAATKTLPTVYTDSCSGCHGADGKTAVGADGDKLAGTALSKSEFLAIVRSGKNGMPAFTTSQVSDAQVGEIWNYFKK